MSDEPQQLLMQFFHMDLLTPVLPQNEATQKPGLLPEILSL